MPDVANRWQSLPLFVMFYYKKTVGKKTVGEKTEGKKTIQFATDKMTVDKMIDDEWLWNICRQNDSKQMTANKMIEDDKMTKQNDCI